VLTEALEAAVRRDADAPKNALARPVRDVGLAKGAAAQRFYG
jgi:hypothetical protein